MVDKKHQRLKKNSQTADSKTDSCCIDKRGDDWPVDRFSGLGADCSWEYMLLQPLRYI